MLQLSYEDLLMCLPGTVFWQDTNSVFAGCNNAAFKLFGFKSSEHMIGSTPLDFCCSAVESAGSFMEHDKYVVKNHSELQLMIIDTYANNTLEAYFVTKKPILLNNQTAGVMVHGMPITNDALLKIGLETLAIDMHYSNEKCQKKSYLLKNEYGDINLSNREAQCLFYLLRKKSVPDISAILNISKRTIESYINHVKLKMNCFTQTELCEKATTLGFLDIIPCSLISSSILKI